MAYTAITLTNGNVDSTIGLAKSEKLPGVECREKADSVESHTHETIHCEKLDDQDA